MYMTRHLLTATVALLFVVALAAPGKASDPSGLIERLGGLPAELIKAKKTDNEIVDALFLATLARLPSDQQRETAAKHLAEAKHRESAARDLAWALVNTKEFLKLHGLDKDVAASLKLLNEITAKGGKDAEKKEKK
jgi:hypothetical protein